MRILWNAPIVFIFIFSALAGSAADSASADDCACPKLSCNPTCESQTDLTFYSAKCDGGNRVKSCSRPTCVPLEDAPPECKVADHTPNAGNSNGAPNASGGAVSATNLGVNGQPVGARMPASTAPVANSAAPAAPTVQAVESIGRVIYVAQPAWRIAANGQKTPISVTMELYENDHIATGPNGRAVVVFNSGNRLNVTPNSEVRIRDASDSKAQAEKKRMVLDLLKGEIRNEVNQKYDGKKNYYRVYTKSAVAGVRGTIFIVSANRDQSGHFVTLVATLRGRVQLSNLAHTRSDLIAKNEAGAYVEEPSGGVMTSVHALSARDIEKINAQTEFAPGAGNGSDTMATRGSGSSVNSQDVAWSQSSAVCHVPDANYNQCEWTCEHNPAGEKKCRVDLPNVQCVRRICDANGDWVSPARLPASYSNLCHGDRPVVGHCDY